MADANKLTWRDLKWFKQVGDPDSSELAYWTVRTGDSFALHWHKRGKMIAGKPKIGEVIVLKQRKLITHLVVPISAMVWEDPDRAGSRWPFARAVLCLSRLGKHQAPRSGEVFLGSLQGGSHGNGVSLPSWCESRGVSTEDQQRKIWCAFFGNDGPFHLASADAEDGSDGGDYEEGNVLLRAAHEYRERNRQLVEEAKQRARKRDPLLRCEACEFSFAEMYGTRGDGFIEAHHRTPISELTAPTRFTVEDIALLCSNCHRMIHRSPYRTVEELAEELKRQAHKSRPVVGS